MHKKLIPFIDAIMNLNNSEIKEFKLLIKLFNIEYIGDIKEYIVSNRNTIQRMKDSIVLHRDLNPENKKKQN